jgi:2-succinyl-6-hydroxy-2,4-cyclohexadiene-1-carboxylate synthase
VNSELELHDFLQSWYQQPLFGDILSKVGKEKLFSNKSLSDIKGWQESICEFSVSKQKDSSKTLRRYSCYYISGEIDKKYTLHGNLLEGTEHIVVSHCGHNTHLEDPNRFLDILNTILQTET